MYELDDIFCEVVISDESLGSPIKATDEVCFDRYFPIRGWGGSVTVIIVILPSQIQKTWNLPRLMYG